MKQTNKVCKAHTMLNVNTVDFSGIPQEPTLCVSHEREALAYSGSSAVFAAHSSRNPLEK